MIPKEFESISFPFMQAKIGRGYFWVKRIEYEIVNNSCYIFVWLEGGELNKYRELALAKALFQEKIHWREEGSKYDFELDEMINRIYRN